MKTLFCFLLFLSLHQSELCAQLLIIHHIDVGQGDATLIQLSDGKTVLIDAGNTGKGKNVVLPYLQALGITSLDYLIASHYHADHIGGLDEVIEGLSADSVRFVLDRGNNPPLPTTKAFSQYWTAAENTRWHSHVALGQTIELSDNLALRCLAVDGFVLDFGEVKNSRTDENNLSLAWLLSLKHTIGDRTYTFKYFTGGDCGGVTGTYADLETPLAAVAGDVDALKVNHHGSRYSTNQTFLDSLRPEAVVISVGDRNSYGHPTQETLDRLQNAESVQYIYQTETGNGGTVPKVKVLGTVTIAVYDSFYTVGTDTFKLSSDLKTQNNPLITSIREPGKRLSSEMRASILSETLILELAEETFVSISLFNLLGQHIQKLAEGHLSQGTHRIDFAHLQLPAGVYFIRLGTPSDIAVKKLLILQ